ncbi:multidrug effflux MFS transporter [Pseudoroseicyclus aestuarii]|uniref:DHA1 family bicyclomycin/chloramphenicol resistance-like MFS transporter n=1 Tax=Pseudoroseicyclus aestuarii TaxID=1795041 RepID=A0A318SXF0_9RHOB|nr:multidrug effflux MFS transporter [Pseudoroseicyclus aestuarii]PYE86093.1 DHA1 family bicyclomycin/chloramphenicol resistance-like MFS transporter [Pseudoroseicyclus aestuarii]
MTARAGQPRPALSQTEFILLLAMLTAVVAFSIDSMLPAMPEIAEELTPADPNRAQLILTSFILGMGIGTFFVGPIADAVGRKPTICGGVVIYCAGALLAWHAPTLELVLAARMLQGLGAAAPRVVALALVRDVHGGRDMARIMSFVMMIFAVVPAMAPLIGTGIIAAFGWRATFLAYCLFACTACAWLMLRQPETLPPERRTRISLRGLLSALREVTSNTNTMLAIAVQTLCMAMLFALLSSIQPMFDVTFDLAWAFPYFFAGMALLGSSGSALNARLVGKTGMRPLVKAVLTIQVGMSALMILVSLLAPSGGTVAFVMFLLWIQFIMFQNGMTLGNLNALALEPMGHIAGFAASFAQAIGSMGAALIAIPIGLSFSGSPVPIAAGALICALLGVVLTGRIKREQDAD